MAKEEQLHTLSVLDQTGDTKYHWDPKNPATVKEAKSVFDKLIRDNQYLAYSMKGTETNPIDKFDEKERDILMTPSLSVG